MRRAVGLLLLAGTSVQFGAAFAVTLFDRLGPAGTVLLRLDLWRYIRRLHEGGTTILLTTHYLEEAEELCEDIALIRGGRIIARDTANGLRTAYGADTLADVYVRAMAA